MMPTARIRTIVCMCVAAALLVTLLGGSTFAASADSRRKIVILDEPLSEKVLKDLGTAQITVLYDLALINALAVLLPDSPLLGPALELLDYLGEVSDDVLTVIDPICPTGA